MVTFYLASVLAPLKSIFHNIAGMIDITWKRDCSWNPWTTPFTEWIMSSQQALQQTRLDCSATSSYLDHSSSLGLTALTCLYFPNHTRLIPVSVSALPPFFTISAPTLFQQTLLWSQGWVRMPSWFSYWILCTHDHIVKCFYFSVSLPLDWKQHEETNSLNLTQ